MKSIIALGLVLLTSVLFAQKQDDLTYLSSGGKLKPLHARAGIIDHPWDKSGLEQRMI